MRGSSWSFQIGEETNVESTFCSNFIVQLCSATSEKGGTVRSNGGP